MLKSDKKKFCCCCCAGCYYCYPRDLTEVYKVMSVSTPYMTSLNIYGGNEVYAKCAKMTTNEIFRQITTVQSFFCQITTVAENPVKFCSDLHVGNNLDPIQVEVDNLREVHDVHRAAVGHTHAEALPAGLEAPEASDVDLATENSK